MGKQYAMEVEKSSHIITDPVIAEYVNRIGQNIVKNSDCKVPFTIKVLDSDEINAMALPGGYFYVNSGAILAADDEAELAGVMAHETAHVCAHHAMREMTRLNYAQIASIAPMILIGGWTGYGVYEAESIAIPMTFLQFSREFEAQADYLGIQYMYRAGYDPQALITFFEKIEDLQKHKPGAVARAFSDHPQTPDRIQHSQEEIARILPPRPEYLGDHLGIRSGQGPPRTHRKQAPPPQQHERQEAVPAPRKQQPQREQPKQQQRRRATNPAPPKRRPQQRQQHQLGLAVQADALREKRRLRIFLLSLSSEHRKSNDRCFPLSYSPRHAPGLLRRVYRWSTRPLSSMTALGCSCASSISVAICTPASSFARVITKSSVTLAVAPPGSETVSTILPVPSEFTV